MSNMKEIDDFTDQLIEVFETIEIHSDNLIREGSGEVLHTIDVVLSNEVPNIIRMLSEKYKNGENICYGTLKFKYAQKIVKGFDRLQSR